MSCSVLTEDGNRCNRELEYSFQGVESSCVNFCFTHCSKMIKNIMTDLPETVKLKLNANEYSQTMQIYKIEFSLKITVRRATKADFYWTYLLGKEKWTFSVKPVSLGRIDRGINKIEKLSPELVYKSFCSLLSSLSNHPSANIQLMVTIEFSSPTIDAWREMKHLRGTVVQAIFPDYHEGKYLFRKNGWKYDEKTSYKQNVIKGVIDINLEQNVQSFNDLPNNFMIVASDFLDSPKPKLPERVVDSSKYVSPSAKAKILENVSQCTNIKEFFTQEEINEVPHTDIISFILKTSKNKPLIICLDKDSLFDYWKLEEPGNSWVCGMCQNEDKPYNCNKFYKIPGDITILIDSAAKDEVVKLWNSEKHYTMFELVPLGKVKIGRGIHYIGELSGEHQIFDAIPIILYTSQ
jgi:hypothetical protein